MLLGISLHQPLTSNTINLILACIALALSYISATSTNDLADQKIDAVNHPASSGRPLINGMAKPRDMWLMFYGASLVAISLGLLINKWAVLILVISIAINVSYSLKPLRFSYRTFLAPLVLGVAYVAVPYSLGLAVIGSRPTSFDLIWIIGLYFMFVGRILLKDFRDRAGDKKYNKPTFLLCFGKKATCLLSASLIAIGGIIICYQVKSQLWLLITIICFMASIIYMLRLLYKSKVGKSEQLSIGVGAKMGNGLLIVILLANILSYGNMTKSIQIVIGLVIALLFFINFISYLKDPGIGEIGYKG
jgi:4-hydroxybenzoate polyprenyltransferase